MAGRKWDNRWKQVDDMKQKWQIGEEVLFQDDWAMVIDWDGQNNYHIRMALPSRKYWVTGESLRPWKGSIGAVMWDIIVMFLLLLLIRWLMSMVETVEIEAWMADMVALGLWLIGSRLRLSAAAAAIWTMFFVGDVITFIW